MGSETEVEQDDRWWLGWRGLSVRRVQHTSAGPVLLIGERSRLALPVDHASASKSGSLEGLTGDEIVSAVAFKSGGLRLVFRSGERVELAPAHAWTAVGESGRSWATTAEGLSTQPPAAE